MDILDQMSSAQYAKNAKKNKTSIMANDPLTKSIALQDKNQNTIPIFKPRNEQPTSFQHLKHTHFDTTLSNQKINKVDSHKDTFSIGTQKQNRGVISGIPSSLGVIMSEEHSEDSRNTNNSRNNRRNQRNNTIKINNSNACPIQTQELKQKIGKIQNKNNQLEFKIIQLEKYLSQKQNKIKELQSKLQKQYNRNSQDRKNILKQQQQLFQKQLDKINKAHESQTKRRQQLALWQAKNKQSILKSQIDSLTGVIQKYKTLLQSGNLISEQKRKLQLKYEKQNMQMKVDRQKYMKLSKQIANKSQDLQNKISQFYNEKKQHDRQIGRSKQQLNEQEMALKKQQLKLRRQIKQKQQQIEYKFNQRTKQLDQRERKLQIQYHQVSMLKLALLKQKDQNKQLNEKVKNQYKIVQEKLLQEKQRVYKKEAQLLQKLHIVQMYAQSSKKCNCHKGIPQNIHLMVPEIVQESPQKQRKNNSKGKQSRVGSQNLIQESQELRKKIQNKKINVGDYLLKLEKTASSAKVSNRPIYKLQQFYM